MIWVLPVFSNSPRICLKTSSRLRVDAAFLRRRMILSRAARVLEISQSKAMNQQYDVNIGSANDTLGLEDTVLDSVSELIRDVRTTAISAGGPGITGTQLTGLATALRGRFKN